MNDTTTSHSAPEPERRSSGALRASLPTAAVLACLAAVGLLGHRWGWRAPRFAALFGTGDELAAEDWCVTHAVPESRCIACDPELVGESSEGWCREHGVPESRCTVCHPEILETGVAGDWCTEHGLPESSCTPCHPEIARTGETLPHEHGVAVTHGSHEGERPEDHPIGGPTSLAPIRDPRTCQKHALKVQFASAASMEKAGIVLGQTVERPMSDSIVVNAEVDYDRTRFARISSRVGGTVAGVERDLGASVRAGDALAWVDSLEVGRARAEHLAALAAADVTARAAERARASSDAGFRTEAERLEAEARAREAEIRLEAARQALAHLGLESSDADAPAAPSPRAVPLVAPFDGLVVRRDVVQGDVIGPDDVLLEIADTRRMWVTMDVPQADAHRVELGDEVIFRPDDARDEVVTGLVSWISTAVDEMTRTVNVRADVDNPAGGLRAHSFGRAQIVVRTSPEAVAVPSEAVQWEGCCYVVFVKIDDAIFQTRKVRLGAKDAAYTEITAGLLPGEVVVTTGSHVLKSEILKSSLGAGCTDD